MIHFNIVHPQIPLSYGTRKCIKTFKRKVMNHLSSIHVYRPKIPF
jgi:hypothetical protein